MFFAKKEIKMSGSPVLESRFYLSPCNAEKSVLSFCMPLITFAVPYPKGLFFERLNQHF